VLRVTPFSQPGAILLVIGMLIFQQFILALPFRHNPQTTIKSSNGADFNDYISTIRIRGAPFMMLNGCLLSGAIVSGVYSEPGLFGTSLSAGPKILNFAANIYLFVIPKFNKALQS